MGGGAEAVGAEAGLTLDENLELMLDIQEFLRPIPGLDLESFEAFGVAWDGDADSSMLA